MNRYAYVGHSPTHLVDPMGTIAIAGGFSTSQGLVDTASMINNFTHITNQQVSNFLTTGSADPVNNLSQPNFGACNGCATPSFGPFDIAAVGAAVVNGVRAGAAYVGSRFATSGGLTKPNVSNPKLQNIVDDLYKGLNTKRPVGTGSTADAIRREAITNRGVGGKFHRAKGEQYLRALRKNLRNPNMSNSDRAAIQALIKDLEDALRKSGG